jgi:uncharacterized membrane protein
MTIVETSVVISKPVGKVYEFITTLENQKKLSEYITGVEAVGPLKVGTRYKIETTSFGRKMETTNEVIALEPNQKFGVKTLAAPPASDVTNTYLLEQDGKGTKLTLQMDAVVMAPGMEQMVIGQLKTGLDSSLAALKKAIEG